MAAFWPDDDDYYGRSKSRVRIYRTYTTNDTTATNAVYDCTYTVTNGNWVSVKDEDAPPQPPDYVFIKRREVGYRCDQPRRNSERSVLAALPRGKLKRWKSLKEKRQAWGIT